MAANILDGKSVAAKQRQKSAVRAGEFQSKHGRQPGLAVIKVGAPSEAELKSRKEAFDIVLTDANGMTLYTFDRDTAASGTSACVDKCAANWPALPAQATDQASGDFSIITRADGTRQWAFKGKPLYRWIKDQKAGDRTGDGVNQVWHVAQP